MSKKSANEDLILSQQKFKLIRILYAKYVVRTLNKIFELSQIFYKKYEVTTYKYLEFLYYMQPRRRSWFVFGIGVIAGLSLPPVYFFFVLPFAFMTMIRMADFCQTLKETYKLGFYFSFGFSLVAFHWVAFSMLANLGSLWFLLPISFVGVPLIWATVNAFIFPLYFHLTRFCGSVARTIVFAALWCIFEFIRYKIFNFPMGFLGYSLGFADFSFQFASVVGVLGLSLIIMLWATSYHLLFLTSNVEEFVKFTQYFVMINIAFFGSLFYGLQRLPNIDIPLTEKKIAIIQGNVPVNIDTNYPLELLRVAEITSKAYNVNPDINLIVWPEGTLVHSFTMDFIKGNIKPGVTFVSDILRLNDEQYYNTSIAINGDQMVFRDKKYLAPFGEYIPFIGQLGFVNTIARGVGVAGMTPGKSIESFQIGGNSLLSLICYEMDYTGRISSENTRPDFIINSTNDAWLWYSTGAFHRFTSAKFRAVEEGLPVVRAANSGFSAIIDPFGRYTKRTHLFQEETMVDYIPTALPSTFFATFGNWPFLFISFGIVLYIFAYMYCTESPEKINEFFEKHLKTRPFQNSKDDSTNQF